ncbi:MAG: hypothetical protein HY015_07515 [Bacteroidetes bacterium]|nr:hypothetical protein [Bacteroidota bacterium]
MKRFSGIVSWTITIVSCVSGFYFFYESKKDREPTFVVDPIRPTLVDKELFKNKPLRIVDSTGNEVRENVCVITFYFFNQGNESIKKENILQPLKLRLPKGCKMLDYKLLINIDGVIEGVKIIKDRYSLLNPRTILFFALFVSPFVMILIFLLRSMFGIRSRSEGSPRKKSLYKRLVTRYRMTVVDSTNNSQRSSMTFSYLRLLIVLTAIFVLIFVSATLLTDRLRPMIKENKAIVPVRLLP